MSASKVCLVRTSWVAGRTAILMVLQVVAFFLAIPNSLAPGSLQAQTGSAGKGHIETRPQSQPLAFAVASIRPYNPIGIPRMALLTTPDGISLTGVPLSMIIHQAFSLPDNRILNEPAWLHSERYDIEAKVDADDAPGYEKLTRNERWAMMVALREQRFALTFHHETRTEQVNTLIVATHGPKLKAATADDENPGKEGASAGMPPPLPPAGRAFKPPSGSMSMSMSPQGMRTFIARGATMQQTVNLLSNQLGTTVIHRTGLTGKYDYTLEFAPDLGVGFSMEPHPDAPSQGSESAPSSPQGPSLSTALTEQLGLKLEVQGEPVDVIVIDHIEQPSPN